MTKVKSDEIIVKKEIMLIVKKEIMLASGRLATAAQNVIDADVNSISVAVADLRIKLNEYNYLIIKNHKQS